MIKVRQVAVSINNDTNEELINKIIKKLRIKKEDINSFKINKKSIDARKKPDIYFIYEVILDIKNENKLLKNKDVKLYKAEEFFIDEFGSEKLPNRPVIVGSGPAGLFCGYVLAYYGYKPLIIERGEDIDNRVKTVDEFWNNNKLNLDSNVLFGLGGAGTFSDGKLNTLVKDKRGIGKKVFEIFVECGAPKEILYLNKPHIGTDLLRTVIKNMKDKIIDMGGEFRFNTKLTDVNYEKEKIKSIIVNNNEKIDCDVLVLAIGHSARDTIEMLINKKLNITSKPFAVGVRISHPQEMININQYGMKKHDKLSAASYKLTYKAKNGRGVYSFCMCPGGFVVNSSSEDNRLAINGMSNHARDEKNANSAIIVTVDSDDFGSNVMDGINFQRHLEEKAYKEGKGNIPIQTFKDFKENKITKELGGVEEVFKGKTTLSNLNNIFPKYITESLIEAIDYFDTKIKGFNRDDAILAAVESRTSSAVRIIRDEEFNSNIKGIYPIGEGAGYAGGITTSAMDGIKTAENIINKYDKK